MTPSPASTRHAESDAKPLQQTASIPEEPRFLFDAAMDTLVAVTRSGAPARQHQG